jgi:hypothetical protein
MLRKLLATLRKRKGVKPVLNTNTTPTPDINAKIAHLESTIAAANATLADIRKELAPALRGRGLYDRIEAALRAAPRSTEDLAGLVGSSAAKVTTLLEGMERSRKVYNLGTAKRPRWVWCIGDDADTDTLRATVAMLIRERPLELQEIVAATGLTNRNRISGVLVRLQVAELNVQNLGTRAHARWFIPPADTRAASAKRPRSR